MHHSLQNLSVFNLSPRNAASGHIQFKGDRVSSQLPESNRRTHLCPFSCCVSAGLPRQGEKMLLHSVMRKKPDSFLSRHCHYSMFRSRGCKEKPPFSANFLIILLRSTKWWYRKLSLVFLRVHPPENKLLFDYTLLLPAKAFLLQPLSHSGFCILIVI